MLTAHEYRNDLFYAAWYYDRCQLVFFYIFFYSTYFTDTSKSVLGFWGKG